MIPLLEPQPTVTDQLATEIKRLRQSVGFRLGSVYFLVLTVTLVFMTVLSLWLYAGQAERSISRFGTTLARQLAQSSVDALVRGDLVSLRAQLEKITDVEHVLDATVYDINDQVLAEAGEPPAQLPESAIRAFPAMITFQDSIAGKVVVRVNASPTLRQKNWLYGYLVCSLLLALGLTILVSKALEKKALQHYEELVDQLNRVLSSTSTLPPITEAVPRWPAVISSLASINLHIQDLEQLTPSLNLRPDPKYMYKPTEGSYAELMIECCNLEQLQKQLHHRELHKLLDNFEEQLTKASKLYNANHVSTPGNHVLLRFLVNDVNDASLQAICCAVLVSGLLDANPAESTMSVTLDLRYVVRWHAHDDRPLPELVRNHLLVAEHNEMLQLSRMAKRGEIIVTKGIKQSPAVAEHVKLDLASDDADSDYYRVQRISDGYQRLLEQQITQLTPHHPENTV